MPGELHLALGLHEDKQHGLFVIDNYLARGFQIYGNRNTDYIYYIVLQGARNHEILVSHSFAIMY